MKHKLQVMYIAVTGTESVYWILMHAFYVMVNELNFIVHGFKCV